MQRMLSPLFRKVTMGVAAGPNGELWSSVPLGWTKTWTLTREMGDKYRSNVTLLPISQFR